MFQRELNIIQFLLNSSITKHLFMAKIDIKVVTKMYYEDSCVKYVIVYTNGRTIQGHHVSCLGSRVNIFSQGKVQSVKPISPMQVSTIVSITKFIMSLVVNMWGIVGKYE